MNTMRQKLSWLTEHSDIAGFRLIAHHDLGGYGDGFQVLKRGEWLYVAHLGIGPVSLSILEGSDPANLELVRQLRHPPNTRCHKVQIVDDVLIQNNELPYWRRGDEEDSEKRGLSVFDLSEPSSPELVGFHPSASTGTHRLWFAERPYAHIASFQPDDRYRSYEIVDLSDPSQPKSVGCWWIPGSRRSDKEPWPRLREGERFGVHGIIPSGDRAYVACLDAGMAVVDISDPSQPALLGHIDWSPPYGGFVHTTLPLPARELVIATDEGLPEHIHGGEKKIWVVDVRDPRQPVTIATFPEPTPPVGTGADDYRSVPGRHGPHNLHENRPGSFVDDETIFATYFNAGLRVYNVANQYRPEEIAHFVPPAPVDQEAPMLNDVFVDDKNIVYVTDREKGGLYVLEYTGTNGD